MSNGPLILGIETATRRGSVAVKRNREVLASRTGATSSSHSESLLEDIGSALKDAGVRLQDVDLFAAAAGPGSFTGLRIGLATVKGLAATLERPVVGVQTLLAVAYEIQKHGNIVAAIPAGRGELFAEFFDRSAEGGGITSLGPATHLPLEELLSQAASLSGLHWAGEGSWANREAIRSKADAVGINFTDGKRGSGLAAGGDMWVMVSPSGDLAVSVAALALDSFRRGEQCPAADLRAIYVRPPDARINEACSE
jgi:tRNA threonylcarbamoyladenosine biosynthesis protein TsaB